MAKQATEAELTETRIREILTDYSTFVMGRAFPEDLLIVREPATGKLTFTRKTKIKAKCDTLPASVKETLAKLQAIEKRIDDADQREADALQEDINTEIASKSFGSFEANKRVAVWLQRVLNKIHRLLECECVDKKKNSVGLIVGQIRCRASGFYIDRSFNGKRESFRAADDHFPDQMTVVPIPSAVPANTLPTDKS